MIYASARGLADIEAGRPVRPRTVFQLASITKQFTAAVILQLVDEGFLSLDDPVARFFPDYPQPGAWATVRQLLNHTSGIQDYIRIPGWVAESSNRPHTTAELIAAFRDRPSRFEPGQGWEYNNGGYALLGAIIEQVTGKYWNEAIAERITRRFGLETIAYGDERDFRPAMALGHTDDEGRPRRARGPHMSVLHAGGALVGTAGDVAEWAGGAPPGTGRKPRPVSRND